MESAYVYNVYNGNIMGIYWWKNLKNGFTKLWFYAIILP